MSTGLLTGNLGTVGYRIVDSGRGSDCSDAMPSTPNTIEWKPVHVSEMKYLDLHGERVAYRDAGAGEALLLIHGMAGSSATWRAVLPQLSKKYRVVAPDLFGHGESAKPRGDYSLGAFAAWLRDLLNELGITRATVVGQSLGGGVAMQFTYQHRDYCDLLVLISSGGLGPDLSCMLRLLSAPGAELVLPVVAPQPVLNVGNKLGPGSLRPESTRHAPVRYGAPIRRCQTASHGRRSYARCAR